MKQKDKIKQTASDIHSANLRIKILEKEITNNRVTSIIQVGRIDRLKNCFIWVGIAIVISVLLYDPVAEGLLMQHASGVGLAQRIVIGVGLVLIVLGGIL